MDTRRTRTGVDPFLWTGALHHSLRFKGVRRLIAERRVQAPWIVEAIDVLADRVRGGGLIGPRGRVELVFQRAEEAVDDGVIPTVASPTHTRHDAVRREDPLIVAAGVLDTAVRVM